MDLKLEKNLIKFDAEFAIQLCEDRSESRYLEKKYVFDTFISEFERMIKEKYVDNL